MSSTTSQTIVQIQIAGCTSHCQGVTQMQVASQTSTTMQSVGSAGQLAQVLDTPPSSDSTSQVTSTITQVQLGCQAACFGTTTNHPSTASPTQLVLSMSGSLASPAGTALAPPPSATEQSVVDQVSCQMQEGGNATTQAQTAVQASTTVQVVQIAASLPALLEQATAPQSADQTQQQIWQVQIGCLFYCVGSLQVQQAKQSTTTIVIVSTPPGSTATAVVQQQIWQVQIGCLAWCWDSTQLQEATSSTTGVVTGPNTGGAPAPSPGPESPPAPQPVVTPDTPGAPPPSSASPSAPPAGRAATSATRPGARIRIRAVSRATGLAILGYRPTARATEPVEWAAPSVASGAATASETRETTVAHVSAPALHASSARRRRAHPLSSPAAAALVLAPPAVTAASERNGFALSALLLAAAVAALFAALLRKGWR